MVVLSHWASFGGCKSPKYSESRRSKTNSLVNRKLSFLNVVVSHIEQGCGPSFGGCKSTKPVHIFVGQLIECGSKSHLSGLLPVNHQHVVVTHSHRLERGSMSS